MFNKQIYINRRRVLKNNISTGILLFIGNDESPMNYADNPYHFRQDSTFLYYFGLNLPGLSALIDIDNDYEIVFGNDLTIDAIVWTGKKPTIKEQAQGAGITKTDACTGLFKYLNEAKQKGRTVHFLPPYRAEHQIKLLDWLAIHPTLSHEYVSVDFIKAVAKQRIYKSDEEVDEIEKAVNISVDMHTAAIKIAKPGMTEAQIAAEVHKVALAEGGNISFPIILTKNGQTLHNHYHGNTINKGDLVLCDAGAETKNGYAGDLSSTFPVSKSFTQKQKDIYEIALAAHNLAIEKLSPEVTFKDIHLQASSIIADGLKQLGILRGNISDIVEKGVHAMFFPCGTGHMLGLDVHDMENLGEVYVGYDGKPKSTQFGMKSLRLARKLEPGFVVTIEPGIYFIPELIDLWQSKQKFTAFINYEKINEYRSFGGIRNEEDVLITQTSAKVLGKPKPKTIDEIESLRELN